MKQSTITHVGAWTVTTLWDGDFPADAGFVAGADPSELKTLFMSADLGPEGPSMEPVNAFALERNGDLWLIDAGVGTDAMPGFGRVPDALRALGHEPERVKRIVLTHLHEDHIGGLVAGGRAVFPNAQLYVSDSEIRFWLDPAAPGTAHVPPGNFELARAVMDLYAGGVTRVNDGGTIASGLSYRHLPGHTPGHSGVMIEDGGESLLMWADTTHSNLLQLAHPEWGVGFDVDKDLTRATRLALLEELTRTGLRVMGSHVTGVGRIDAQGGGYVFRHQQSVQA